MNSQVATTGPLVAAVDFGASSIRVSIVDLERRPLEPVVVHRYQHRPVRHSDGSLRWDWSMLVAEAQRGIANAKEHGTLASIGIDTWGLDYGLIDGAGMLVAPPHSYRDERLRGWETVADRIGPQHLYELTGTQLMAGNTIFQLAAHSEDELRRTRHVLMLPELLLHELCGITLAERTSVGTTALIDHRSGQWSDELIDAIGADRSWFPEIHFAGERVGTYDGIPVHLVGGHDTASAVLAMGPAPEPNAAFLSAGTLFLVGQDQQSVRTDAASFERNISHEPGVFGGFRRLCNLPGMWLLEECRRSWGFASVSDLFLSGITASESTPCIDVTDPSLIAPDDMPSAIARLAGVPPETDAGAITSIIVRSMAAAVTEVINRVDDSSQSDALVIFGGGSQAQHLVDQIGTVSGRHIEFGPIEATTLGNALAQGIALGVFHDTNEARAAL